ncbi:MAG: hypothetical protein GWN87_15450, partial [Desulfuromonadales bacterium]|nr:hypothetical protein [Desulfuromonadales bacterium]NIS40454.1 hypothetical protein [Desulfuromonadales bacterium]
LQYLPRMFMPLQNYQDLEPEVLEAYRHENRDIRPVSSFSSLVPEVYYFSEEAYAKLCNYLDRRIRASLETGPGRAASLNKDLDAMYEELRRMAEEDLRRRVELMRRFVDGEMGWANPEDVFRHRPSEDSRR